MKTLLKVCLIMFGISVIASFGTSAVGGTPTMNFIKLTLFFGIPAVVFYLVIKKS